MTSCQGADSEKDFLKLKEEEAVRQRIDENGDKWAKVYFGGGEHMQNWLSQTIELKGEANVKVEEVASSGFRCYEAEGGKMYRIWVRETDED